MPINIFSVPVRPYAIHMYCSDGLRMHLRRSQARRVSRIRES